MDSKTGSLAAEATYRPSADDDGTMVTTPAALWASESIEQFKSALAAQFGIPEGDVITLNVTTVPYTPGICSGSLKIGGKVLNLGVWDEEAGRRVARMLHPVEL
jgi:hypothetical protein